jgi:cell division protein FtsI (penicillin-binding protein 3)
LFFFVFLLLSIARLLYIQLFRSNYFAGIAGRQHNLFVELEPRRGTIYDHNLKPQAVNVAVDSLYASPNLIPDKDKESVAKRLSAILDQVDHAYLRERLSRKKSFIWLARKITPRQSDAIKKLSIKGLGFIKESRRSYPNSYLGSQTIGFCGLDNIGLEGLELRYNNYLKGTEGWALLLRDARQNKLNLEEKMALPIDGYNLVLTVDEVMQYIAERELDKAFKVYRAKGASLIVMDPKTGAILAMVNRPTFDLNQYKSSDKENRRNRAITDLFEPGSVFKIVTASAALEEKKLLEEDTIFCENGSYRVGGHVLHDHRPHGLLTFREVIEQSSNIGTSKVAQMLGPDTLYKYIRLFGFGVKTGIDLPGEISGMTKEPRFWSKTSITAVPMGQEVGVTALQLASAISVIANGGELMKPYIVSEIRDRSGETIKSFSPVVVRRVVSEETAGRVSKILFGAVEQGTGKLARIPGFSAAGKTGTAQKIEPNGAYSHNKFMASFIGFAPAENPVVAIVVVVDEPRPYYFGGVVAAPVFKNVAGDILKYIKTKYTHKEISALNESARIN